jgi:hypothetical protein
LQKTRIENPPVLDRNMR